jgi:ferredoxin-NADP reductase
VGHYLVKVLDAEFINHDVKRFIVEKPPEYAFIPGQGTELAINLPDWKKQFRPFTYTNLNSQNYLEFMVKIYTDRNGVTKQLGKTNAGAEFIIGEPFGAINYKGPGVFLAGGSGITPFISIFRHLYKENHLRGNRLIYSNRTVEDIILYQELQKMLKTDLIPFFSHENKIGFGYNRIDRNYIIAAIKDFSQYFYLCGPEQFIKDMTKILLDLGADLESLVVEE